MGGGGRRRREKNYRAAHGGYSALPPPPDPSQVDALPSKLRRIISFTSSPQSQPQGAAALTKNIETRKKREDGHAQNDKGEVGKADVKQGGTHGELEASRHTGSGNEQFIQSNASKKKKNKRKRKEVRDLRFEEVEKTSSELKRRERKKKYLEAKKKKQKKTKTEESLESLEFPGREQIKFGDIVEAPPKLAIIPKAFKKAQDASQERLRLKAIEGYRSRKGWTSRPGSQLLPPVTSSTTP
ncbi:hypothetical protein L6164_000822 [Bauhinia variegata]|uniref:Uncharacterized protein n=1 Tax=Bauhinia variegata TaxID=167791 RepID=A0ACB9Q899_BAUVA|nr:hypothetical protein L6164_000822 [Bauhinia variegata]